MPPIIFISLLKNEIKRQLPKDTGTDIDMLLPPDFSGAIFKKQDLESHVPCLGRDFSNIFAKHKPNSSF